MQPVVETATVRALAQRAVEDVVAFNGRLLLESEASAVIRVLKGEVDHYRGHNNQEAMRYAQAIIRLGEQREDKSFVALGLMSLGDTIAITGHRLQEAWNYQQQAAGLYVQIGDMVGWARTAIGRVAICIELDRVEETMVEAKRAAEVFRQYYEFDLFVRLAVNLMKVFNVLGRFQESISTFQEALPIALDLPEAGGEHVGLLYNNVGNAYLHRGEFHQAREYFELAEAVFTKLEKFSTRRVVSLNIAYVEQSHGLYHRALRMMHQLLADYGNELSNYHVHAKMYMLECYLRLNKYSEAYELAQDVIDDLGRLDDPYPSDWAHSLRYLAEAEANLGQFEDARKNLLAAETRYAALRAETWKQFVSLMRGRLAQQQGDDATALKIASVAADFFAAEKQPVNLARALLLRGHSLFALGEVAHALTTVADALQLARECRVPDLLYSTHLLLGLIQMSHGNQQRSKRHYQAALATIQRYQSNLTITLSPSFLEDKNEALHALMRLYLGQGSVAEAFETLERSKSQVLLGYLANRQRLYWPVGDSTAQALIQKLDHLREEHHLLYRMAYETALLKEGEPILDAGEARQKLIACERQMRAISEQLYLLGADHVRYHSLPFPGLEKVQSILSPAAVLVEYYDDGDSLWAFVVNQTSIRVTRLPTSVAELDRRLRDLDLNLRATLSSGAQPTRIPGLLRVMKRLGRTLYEALIKPLPVWETAQRLIVVPYGLLHYLPFNILHTGDHYLIEVCEIVLAPTSGFLTRETPIRPAGAVVLAHSNDGRLPHTLTEADVVHKLLSGRLYQEQTTSRKLLAQEPVQILHIAAHGKHRMDQPDLSFVQLGDGQLFTDDLLQQDLSYELVTLSACETGQAVVKPGEELIGLGRGVLCAGAGALLASLWRVEDSHTAEFMECFYHRLNAGESKAAALRMAQCQMLQRTPDLHPAFWGAFQLVGDGGPLSTFRSL